MVSPSTFVSGILPGAILWGGPLSGAESLVSILWTVSFVGSNSSSISANTSRNSLTGKWSCFLASSSTFGAARSNIVSMSSFGFPLAAMLGFSDARKNVDVNDWLFEGLGVGIWGSPQCLTKQKLDVGWKVSWDFVLGIWRFYLWHRPKHLRSLFEISTCEESPLKCFSRCRQRRGSLFVRWRHSIFKGIGSAGAHRVRFINNITHAWCISVDFCTSG